MKASQLDTDIAGVVYQFIDRMNDVAPECGDPADRILGEFVRAMNPLLSGARRSAPSDVAEKLIDKVAKAMADEVELDWDKLSEERDIACGHGFPEGCKRYWRDLAEVAIAEVRRK